MGGTTTAGVAEGRLVARKEVHTRTGHEGPAESRGIAVLFFNLGVRLFGSYHFSQTNFKHVNCVTKIVLNVFE
jgi:hypothetical protein